MARTSRKGAARQAAAAPTERVWHTAVYARLSLEDSGRKGADTIETQIELVESYLRKNPQLRIFDTYVDNGESGKDFDRPAWNRLMDYIRSGKVDCVAVKDLSRFGRNYVEACELLDKIFPFMGVRFISVNDGYDSAHSSSTDALIYSLKNLINDKYLRDISYKVSSSIKARQARKEFIGAYAPFGYKKSVTEKGKLVPDEETAPIVRQIFTWRAEGMGHLTICKKLDKLGVMPPMGWLRERYNVCGDDYYKATVWQTKAIQRMIGSRIYIGHLEQGKSSQALYAHKPFTAVPKSEWVITENTHEPIVSAELWEAANAVADARRKEHLANRSQRDLTENILRGFLVCGVCGSKLVRAHTLTKNPSGREYEYFSYSCPLKRQHPAPQQFGAIQLNTIVDVVFPIVSQRLAQAASWGAMIEKRTKRQQNPRAALDTEIAKITRELSKTADRLAGLYEHYADREISEQEYVRFKAGYESDAASLRERLAELSQRAALVVDVSVSENRWLAALRSFQAPTELTRPMLETLVERIVITGSEPIEVIWNFGDDYARLEACAREEDC